MQGVAIADRIRTMRDSAVGPSVATAVMAKSLSSDADATGHLLRREWWPIGWLALASSPRSRVARAAAWAMLLPLAHEWLTERPGVDLPRYLMLRLADDAAYGSGVIVGALRSRVPRVLLPHIRLPRSQRDQKKP